MSKKPQMEYFKPVVLLHQTILLWCFLVSSVTSQSGIVKSTSAYQDSNVDLKQLLAQAPSLLVYGHTHTEIQQGSEALSIFSASQITCNDKNKLQSPFPRK